MRLSVLTAGVIGLFVLSPKVNAALPFGGEGGLGLSFGGGSTTFNISGNALLNVHKSFYVRTSLFSLSSASGGSIFSLGTGAGIDVMYFFTSLGKLTPYGFGGFAIVSGGGLSTTDFRFGGGADFVAPNPSMKFYAEASLEIVSASFAGTSSSNTSFSIMGGVRVR